MAHLEALRQLIVKTPGDKWRWGQYLAHSALALVLQGETGDALERVIASHRLLKLPPGRVPLQLRQFYVAQAFARLWQYRRANGSQAAICRKRLHHALKQLRKTGYHTTLHAHRLCIEANPST